MIAVAEPTRRTETFIRTSRPMTLESCIAWIVEQPRWAWSLPWWRTGEIIVRTPSRDPERKWNDWSIKEYTRPVPPGLELLGCTGADALGNLAWVYWDFDVGNHGTTSYPALEDAIADARRLRNALDGRAEIRLSKSGKGVHVRHLVDAGLPAASGPKIAKGLAAKLNLRADATPLGRQASWLWARDPAPNAFRLIEPHEGL